MNSETFSLETIMNKLYLLKKAVIIKKKKA